jgi:hypothetical protein
MDTYDEGNILDGHYLSGTVSQIDERRTLVLDDTLAHSNSGVGGHLNLLQMPALKAQLPQLPSPISWWIIA